METPKHPLTIQQSNFLTKLRSYLPEKIYFVCYFLKFNHKYNLKTRNQFSKIY